MDELAANIRNFLQYLVVHFIEDKESACLKLSKNEEEKVLSFRIILSERDVAKLIGKNGYTASSIRSVIKSAGDKHGVNVILRINSTKEEEERLAGA